MKGKGLVTEFKNFINQGNVMDMAVGIIIGAAFTAIVTSLVDNIITPLIMLVTGGNGTEISGLQIPVGGGQYLDFGAFLGAIINFLIIALCVFFIVKAFNKMRDHSKKLVHRNAAGEEVAEEAPVCPYCKEEVNVGATRCHHCAADLPAPAKPTETVVA